MEKVIKNGQVGVLISPGYGAGWSTWNHDVDPKVMMMDARIIKAWQAGRLKEENVFEVLKELGIIDDDDYVYYWNLIDFLNTNTNGGLSLIDYRK